MKIFRIIASIIKFIFGSFTYQPPGLIILIWRGVKKIFIYLRNNLNKIKTSKPKIYFGLVISVSVLLLLISGYTIWQSSLPEQKKLLVLIEAPGLAQLIENAKPDRVLIKFNGSAARLEDVQKGIKTGIEIYPSTKGEWKWIKDDRLQFTPEKDWSAGTEYTVKMDKKLFPSHVLLEEYEKTFRTSPFKLNIVAYNFYVDPVNENLKQITATVKFSHPVKPESFEKYISLRPYIIDTENSSFENRDYRIDVTYDEFFRTAYLLSEGLPMPEDDITMELTIENNVECSTKGVKSKKKISSTVVIPGITNYIKINSITQRMVRNEDYNLDQVLIIDSKGKASIKDLENNMEVWILPNNKPKAAGIREVENYRWSDPAFVGPEVLNLSSKLVVVPIEPEHEYESINSFKILAEPGKYIYIKINKGTPFYGKYNLSKEYDTIIRIQKYPKQLEIMNEGILLSSTGEKKISLMSQGVNDVQFRIGRIHIDQLNHLVSQSDGDLKNLRFTNYKFSEDNIIENYYEEMSLKSGDPGEANYFSFDFTNYLDPQDKGDVKTGIFIFEVSEWDRQNKRKGSLSDKRLIMVSDLGVLVKDGSDNTHDIFVQSISTGLPVSKAKIQVLGKNGIPLVTSRTDKGGHVSVPSLMNYNREKTPTVYVISKGDDISFLPLNAPSRWMNYSRFDVGGVHGASDPNKISGYLFSDRGIYRPGDEFNIGMVIKTENWSNIIVGTPLEAVVIDARGLEIFRKKFKLSESGFEELKYKTENTSPTGTYQINLFSIKNLKRHHHIGSTTIEIEEFLPDRLSITSVFPGVSNLAWVSPENLKNLVTLRNLFGSPAKGNRIVAKMSLSPGRMWFKDYTDFTFSDPLSSGKSITEILPEKITDNQGKAVFDFNFSRFESATYRLTFEADGFEKEGGRSVSTASQILVSPLPYLIGTQANGDLSYIYKDSERILKVIAINPDLKKIAVQGINFELNRIDHISVLTKLPNKTYAYKSVPKSIPISTTTKEISIEGLDYALPTNDPGEYEIIIKNGDNAIFSRLHFSVVGNSNLTRSLDKNAELEIKLNKTDYEPGEEIEVFVKAPYMGAGLITIERDKIYSYHWFKNQSNSFIEKIKLPAKLEGNGYINVSFVRAADSKEVYMSPLSYGIAPFSVSKKDRIQPIQIDFPTEARSGEIFPIKYLTDQPGRIVVFAVDEGILQVAGYNTPNPLEYFFKKRALEVKTSQLMDLILPEYRLYGLNAAMGGGSGFEEIASNLNPFKRKQQLPVVFWSGLLESDQTERTLEYKVPDYFNGTLRVIAIFVSEDKIGTYQERATVTNPFIISPNVPMFAAPSDSFLVSVTVTNNITGSGKKLPVNLEVTSTPHLKLYHTDRKVFIDEDSDTTLSFNVKANNLLGGASLNFNVTGHNETTNLASYLSVRPGIPYQTHVTTGSLQDDNVEVETPRILYEDYRILNTSVSFLPLGLSNGLVTYLNSFPYGCTEQVISKAFPYLYLKDVTGFGINDKNADEKINYALKVLQARQNADGKFGIWAANSHTSDFITVYGMHFLTKCKKSGYYVPNTLYNNTLAALKNIASEKKKNLNDLRIQAYAIYTLTQNEVITTNYIASLRKILEEKYPSWNRDLAGAYLAGSYQIMRQNREASLIFNKVAHSLSESDTPWYFCDNSIQNAQVLYLLSKHAPEILEDVSANMISKLASFLENGHYNTITSSYSIMALSAYSAVAGEPQSGEVQIKQILRNNVDQVLPLPTGKFPTVNYSEFTKKLEITNQEDLHLFYQVVQGGFNTLLPEERVSNGIELFREYRDKKGNIVNKVSLGDEVEVHLKFRSLKDENLYNIAIVDLLPAGLEAVPTSVRSNTYGTWDPEYIDIREDRLIIYGTVKPEVDEFIYSVRAVNKGQFTVPPLYGESMYDRSINGISPQEPLIVE